MYDWYKTTQIFFPDLTRGPTEDTSAVLRKAFSPTEYASGPDARRNAPTSHPFTGMLLSMIYFIMIDKQISPILLMVAGTSFITLLWRFYSSTPSLPTPLFSHILCHYFIARFKLRNETYRIVTSVGPKEL